MVAVISNFTPVPRDAYLLPLPKAGRWREVINTDAAVYWGSDRGNFGGINAEAVAWRGRPARATVSLPPLATLIFAFEG